MITQYRVTLLQTVTVISTLIGSVCYAAQQQKIVRTVTPKKDNSNVRYNQIAQKYSAIETPTTQTVQEFTALLEKDKVFFDRKKQCKRELDLLLADITAQSTAKQIQIKKLAAKLYAARKKGFPIEPFRKIEESVDITNEEQEEPTEEIETPAITPREETSTIPEGPTVIPSEPPVTKPDTLSWLNDDETADDSQNVPTYQTEPLEMGNPARELAPFLQKPNELVKESTSIPLNQGGELSFPIGRALDIITEQLQEQVTTPEQAVIVTAFAENTERILSQITPIEQEAVLKSTVFVMNALLEKEPSARPSVLQEIVQPLVNTVSQALVPTTMIQTMQKSQINITQKQQFDLNTLPNILFAAINLATSDANSEKFFLPKINAVIKGFSDKSALIAPTVTAALLLTHEDTTQPRKDTIKENLGAQFGILLTLFDALLDGVDIQKQALQDSLITYTDKGILRKGLDYIFGDTNTPSTLVPKLILLYKWLSTVGPTTIDAIESHIKLYGRFMDSNIVKEFKAGGLIIKSQDLPKKSHNHKRKYHTDLTVKLSQLEKAIQQGNAAITDQKTQKDLEEQLTTLKKKFNEKSRKKEPVKRKTPASRPSQRIKLPGMLAISTRTKAKEQDTVKKEPSKKSTFQEIELPPKPLPNLLLPPPTALAVTDPAFEALKIKIRNLNPQTDTLGDTASLEQELNNFKPTTVGLSAYEETETLLSQKKEAITIRMSNKKRVTELSDIITTITDAKNNQTIVPSITLQKWKRLAQRASTDNTIQQLKSKFTTALKNYCLVLMSIGKTKSSVLHTTAINLVTEKTEELLDIQKITDVIAMLDTDFLPQEKTTIQGIVIGLCAAYDAIMYTLYTPAFFNPRIAIVLKTDTTPLQRYLELIKTAIASIKTIKECIEKLEPFLPEETQKTFRESTLNISTIDTNLIENDAYKYAVPVGTSVLIDTLSIATLQELNAQHRKEYLDMVTAWQARIENNGTIEELKQIDFSTLSPEKLQTLTEQIETLSAIMPTLFETDAVLQELAQKVEINTEKNTVTKLIAQLLKQIQEAQSDFENTKRIAQIEFETGYNNIQASIGTLDPEINPFKTEIENLTKRYADYLTTIAKANVQNISNFPDRQHDNRFAEDINYITISSSFTNMITQLKTLGFLADINNAENSFKELYTVILKGYGYLLATFDALTAKLHDGAQNQQSWGTFFATITGSAQSTQYASAQFIIEKLLKPIELKRSWYYQTLIAPYFTESTEIQNYLQGTLNLLTLGLENIKKEDGSYRSMRTQIIRKPYGEKNTIMITPDAITGKHIPNYGYLSNAIVHGGDAQYTKIINDWHTLIKDILKTQSQNQQVTEVQDMLDTILNIPFGEVTNKKDIELLSTVKPTYKTTFNDMYTSKNTYRKTDTVNQFLYDILNTNDDNTEEELHRYLNDFFIDLSLALSNPTLITKLKTLKENNLLTSEIQDKILYVCGDSFVLLDSVISWAYRLIDYYTNTKSDQDKVIKIGTLLAQYEPYITHSINNVLQLTPYLSADKLKEYNNQGLVISGFVQNTPQQGTMPALYEFFIGTAPSWLNPTKTQPQKLLGLTFLQEGTHTAQTIQDSLALLKAIPQKIGVPSASSIELEILLKLNPLYKMLQMSYTPSLKELTELITTMEPVFAAIQEALKILPQNNKQSYTLNSIARLLISNYTNKFEKQVATPAQKEAYTQLTKLFLQSFTSNIKPNLQKNLTAISTTGTSLTSVKQPPRRQNQQPAIQPTKPRPGMQQNQTPPPAPVSTETAIQLYKPESSGL